MANGERKTVTAVTVVHPTQEATGAEAAPGLQTDSAAGSVHVQRGVLAMGVIAAILY